MSGRKGDGLRNNERCQAVAMRGNRCCFRVVRDGLCERHAVTGALTPDGGWTYPDNLPIWSLPRARP